MIVLLCYNVFCFINVDARQILEENGIDINYDTNTNISVTLIVFLVKKLMEQCFVFFTPPFFSWSNFLH